MDGNGRWAQQKLLPRIEGHKASRKAIRSAIEGSIEQQIPFLSLFAFSIENWKRPKKEIQALFAIFDGIIKEEIDELYSQGVRIHFAGHLERFPAFLQKTLQEAKDYTSRNNKLHLNICLDYSGKDEIVRAVQKIARLHIPVDQIDEEIIQKHLDTHWMPPVDLLIRTSGEKRVSNFMIWQIAYAEMVFIDQLWPDFNQKIFKHCIELYYQRKRRFGAL